MSSNLEILREFLKNPISIDFERLNFGRGSALLTTDSGRELKLPIFDANDIFQKVPENRARNLAETEAIDVWKETGMLLIKDFLPDDVIDGLHDYAMTKIADGADPGDHFRTTAIKTGYEGRGWAQRAALWRNRPQLLASLLSVSKKLQQLIFGQISTTTEIQFNATYSDDIGHIHIDRPAGFLSKSEAEYIDGDLLAALEKMSFQTAFYTGETPRSKGSTGFIPGSNKLLERGINTINFYNDANINSLLAENCYHGDIPKGVAVVFMSSVLHRTGSNQSGTTRIAFLVQNQLSSLYRMEGEVGQKKIEELAFLFDLAFHDPWLFSELYENYPFPADLANPDNAPTPGLLAPRTLAQHLKEFGLEKFKAMTTEQRRDYIKTKLYILHGGL